MTMDEFQVAPEIKEFCMKAAQQESGTSRAILRLTEELRHLKPTAENQFSLNTITRQIEKSTSSLKQLKNSLEQLTTQSNLLPPLMTNNMQNKQFLSLSELKTKDLQIRSKEVLQVTSTCQQFTVKVRTADGKEGFIPVLSLILPGCSDKNISTLIERLELQLLSAWRDALRRLGASIFLATNTLLEEMTSTRSSCCQKANGSVDYWLTTLNTLYQTTIETLTMKEKETGHNEEIFSLVAEAFHMYQNLNAAFINFLFYLEDRKPRSIRIIDNISEFRKVTNMKQLRYYETKLTVESTETKEETIHTMPSLSSTPGSGTTLNRENWKQSVAAEQLTSSSLEESQRYVIRAVRDPRDGTDISLQDAIQLKIIDPARGIYCNPDTGEQKAITMAMTDGLIQVEMMTKTQTAHKTEALGLVTIRDRISPRRYNITGAVDALTGEKLDLTEAKRREILDEDNDVYTIGTTGQKISLDEAIDSGWIYADVEADDTDADYEVKTYAVGAVVDQIQKKKVSFLEAVERGLIDKNTGNYINNLTGEKVYVVEAIKRGFLKAQIVEDPSTLNISAENKMMVERMGKIKQLVAGMGVISSLKQAVQRNNNNTSQSDILVNSAI